MSFEAFNFFTHFCRFLIFFVTAGCCFEFLRGKFWRPTENEDIAHVTMSPRLTVYRTKQRDGLHAKKNIKIQVF